MKCANCPNGIDRLGRFAPVLTALSVVAVVLLLLMAAVAQAGTMQASWRLAVADSAVARGEHVLLGDIASPVGELPDKHWKTLAATKLWKAPANEGEQQNISRGKLGRLLHYHLGDIARLCVVSGPMTLQRGGKLVDGPDLERLVVETLTPQVAAMRGEVTLRDFRLPTKLFLGDSQNTLSVDPVNQVEPGRISLLIREKNPAQITIRKYTGTVFMDQWVNVACAARPINSREEIAPDMVTFKRKNAAYLRGEPWDGKRFGMRAERPMGAGEVIYLDNLDDVPLIARGETVELVYDGRYVRLTASAEALEDGRMGESIPVRNLQSNREIVAKVRDGDTVVVH